MRNRQTVSQTSPVQMVLKSQLSASGVAVEVHLGLRKRARMCLGKQAPVPSRRFPYDVQHSVLFTLRLDTLSPVTKHCEIFRPRWVAPVSIELHRKPPVHL